MPALGCGKANRKAFILGDILAFGLITMDEEALVDEETLVEEETLLLGNNIHLAGFKEVDPSRMVVVKKIVGNYVRKFEERYPEFHEIKIHLKKIHASGFEVQVDALIGSEHQNGEVTEYNLFFALDKALGRALAAE